jgi:hypothetical protein
VVYKSPEATWAVFDFRDSDFALWSREGSGLLVDRGDQAAKIAGEIFEVLATSLGGVSESFAAH